MENVAETRGRPKPEERVDKVWLRPDEAAHYSGIGLTRIYYLIKTGALPSARVPGVGGKRVTHHIKRTDLDAYLEKYITATK